MKILGIGLYWDNLEVGEQFKTLLDAHAFDERR